MIAALLLALQAGGSVPLPPGVIQARYDECLSLAERTPPDGARYAQRWRTEGGTYFARQCEGVALADQGRWAAAAAAFEDAAHTAELAHDKRSAAYWSQAGNAWLAGGDAAKARAALDAAIASGELEGLALGEVRLDRARALVAAGDLKGARTDLDSALTTAKDDPLAWLLSATLARRTGDLDRAQEDIVQALRLAPDDAQVELERGNIAAARGDASEAQAGWREAMKVQPESPAAASAAAALQQFEGPKPAGR